MLSHEKRSFDHFSFLTKIHPYFLNRLRILALIVVIRSLITG